MDTSVLLDPPSEPILGDIAISCASMAELHFGVLVASSDAVRAERLHRLAGWPRLSGQPAGSRGRG